LLELSIGASRRVSIAVINSGEVKMSLKIKDKNLADRLPKDLVDFVLGNFHLLDPEQVSPDLRPLVLSHRRFRAATTGGSWVLRLTGKNSPADNAKIDCVWVNTADGRWFPIDFTVDESKKHLQSSITLCTMYVFKIDTNEDDRPDVDTKIRFMEMLLELMDSISLLNMKDTHYPSPRTDMTWAERVVEEEAFINRLNAKATLFETSDADDLLYSPADAKLLREWSAELSTKLRYTRREHEAETNQNLVDQKEQFKIFCSRMLPQAARRCLNASELDCGQSQTTHSARYEANRDVLLFRIGELYIVLENMSARALDALNQVGGKPKANDVDFYTRKRRLKANCGRDVLEVLVRIINSTPAQKVVGSSFPAPAEPKPAKQKGGKKNKKLKKTNVVPLKQRAA
jgi:hypothetical protein